MANTKRSKKRRYNTCHAEGCRKPRARRGLCLEHFAKEYPGKKGKQATPAETGSETAS
jgi:hypothetical protein